MIIIQGHSGKSNVGKAYFYSTVKQQDGSHGWLKSPEFETVNKQQQHIFSVFVNSCGHWAQMVSFELK